MAKDAERSEIVLVLDTGDTSMLRYIHMKNTQARNHGRFISFKQRAIPVFTILALTIAVPWMLYPGQPVKLQSPLVDVVHADYIVPVVVAPHAVEFTYDQVYDYVWMRESGKGTNNPVGSNAQRCYENGKVNEIGASGTKHSICFKNRDEQKQFFMDWMKKNMDGNIIGTLCRWNVGLRNNCPYGAEFLKEHTK